MNVCLTYKTALQSLHHLKVVGPIWLVVRVGPIVKMLKVQKAPIIKMAKAIYMSDNTWPSCSQNFPSLQSFEHPKPTQNMFENSKIQLETTHQETGFFGWSSSKLAGSWKQKTKTKTKTKSFPHFAIFTIGAFCRRRVPTFYHFHCRFFAPLPFSQ